jgi:hypothetical protein
LLVRFGSSGRQRRLGRGPWQRLPQHVQQACSLNPAPDSPRDVESCVVVTCCSHRCYPLNPLDASSALILLLLWQVHGTTSADEAASPIVLDASSASNHRGDTASLTCVRSDADSGGNGEGTSSRKLLIQNGTIHIQVITDCCPSACDIIL